MNTVRQTAGGFHLQAARQRPQVFIIDVFIMTAPQLCRLAQELGRQSTYL